MFKFYPQHRNTVMDEFVQSVLTHLSPGKHFPRHFPLPVSIGRHAQPLVVPYRTPYTWHLQGNATDAAGC